MASFFHVIVQGQKKEYIFKEKRFIYEYINLIRKYIKETNIKIVAYCIMGNHAHFLFKVDNLQELSKFMRKINSIYAKYYNFMMDDRVGYVYRDRFLSEPITSHRYLVNCIKYIHFNPVKAKIVNDCSQYKFSSYNFFCKSFNQKRYYDFLSREDYEDICNNINYAEEFLDVDTEKDLEETTKVGIKEFLKENKYELYRIFNDRQVLIELIKYLKENKKITYVAIGKFLGISRGSMNKITMKIRKIK